MINYTYDDYDNETKNYINKALEIYFAIKDKDITRTVIDFPFNKKIEYMFTKNDKKIISLFTASLLVEGTINELFSDFDDISLDKLLDFMGISKKDIKSLSDNYQEIYKKNFHLIISKKIQSSHNDTITRITPAFILEYINLENVSGSRIVEYFISNYVAKYKNIPGSHPLFDTIKAQVYNEGSKIKNKTIGDKVCSSLAKNNVVPKDKKAVEPNSKEAETFKKYLLSPETRELMQNIQKKYIGQEKAAKNIFLNIINNQCLTTINDLTSGQKSTVFIDGPSGTGKTAITKDIVDKLNIGIPIIRTSITQYSKTGYIGGEITSILKKLCVKAKGDVNKAQQGIVIFDEFNKLAYTQENETMKRAVQEELLDFIGGGKYTINVDYEDFYLPDIEFDTSKLTFIGIGALTELRNKKIAKEKEKEKRQIGFSNSNNDDQELKSDESTNYQYIIDKQDLIDSGIIPELANRFNTFLHTTDYSKETLKRQLIESTISPLLSLKQWVNFFDKELIIDEEVYDLIAEKAFLLDAGARGNEIVVDSIRNLLIERTLFSDEKTIHLTTDLVIEAENERIYQTSRG